MIHFIGDKYAVSNKVTKTTVEINSKNSNIVKHGMFRTEVQNPRDSVDREHGNPFINHTFKVLPIETDILMRNNENYKSRIALKIQAS